MKFNVQLDGLAEGFFFPPPFPHLPPSLLQLLSRSHHCITGLTKTHSLQPGVIFFFSLLIIIIIFFPFSLLFLISPSVTQNNINKLERWSKRRFRLFLFDSSVKRCSSSAWPFFYPSTLLYVASCCINAKPGWLPQ